MAEEKKGVFEKLKENITDKEEQLTFKNEYADGISWGDAKKKLFLLMNTKLAPIRDKYFEFQKRFSKSSGNIFAN